MVMTFEKAIKKDLPGHFQKGIQAVEKNDKAKFDFLNLAKVNGSVDIDKALEQSDKSGNRWDYSIGYNNKAYFFEVHSMSSGKNIDEVIKKAQWLELFLKKTTSINSIKQYPFCWIATDAGNQLRITRKSAQWKMLEKLHIEWDIQKVRNHFAN